MSVHHKYISEVQPTSYKVSWFIYFYKCSTCFRRFLSPSSGPQNRTCSISYCQPILLLAAIADEMFHLIHKSSKQQYWLTTPDAARTVLCSWWWAEEPPETCGAFVEINKSRNVASCWLYFRKKLNILKCYWYLRTFTKVLTAMMAMSGWLLA